MLRSEHEITSSVDGEGMARIICIANQKGGVGKTTTSINLSAGLSEHGRRVLLVDMDPQGNASSGLGLKRHEYEKKSIYDVLIVKVPMKKILTPTHSKNLSLCVATTDLVGVEIELVDAPHRQFRLSRALEDVQGDFDYVIIDCPPSLGLLTLNALCAADTFLVPLQCEYYALEGLSQLLNTAGLVRKNFNPRLEIEGIVLTMFDSRNNLSHQVAADIKNHFEDKVFRAVIPRNVRLSEAPSHGYSIIDYDEASSGAQKYRELALELDQKVHPPLLHEGKQKENNYVSASQ